MPAAHSFPHTELFEDPVRQVILDFFADDLSQAPVSIHQIHRQKILRDSGTRCRLELTIGEGKNREVRNMCAAVGLQVERLIRIRQGELSLGDLTAGKWRRLTDKEMRWLQSLQ